MDTTTVVWGISFPTLLFFVALGAGTAFAMNPSSDPIGFLVAKICFAAATFVVVAVAIYWVRVTRQPIPWNLVIPTIAAIVAVPTLILSLQWLDKIDAQLSTRLIPGDQPTPQLPDVPKEMAQLVKDSLKIFYGTNVSVVMATATTPHTILQMAGEPMLQFERGKRGELVISVLRIFDDRNNIIARLDDEDGIWVENSTRKKRPDPSTLVVYDHSDKEVLRVVFLNPNALSVTGVFRHQQVRTPVIITPEFLSIGGAKMTNGVSGAAIDISVGANR
jgi:hypothetical protein